VQALARAHSLGRAGKGRAPMRILRLFMRNSVEEKILLLAERKGGVSAAFRPGSAAGCAGPFH
jgi:SNF2 family DNA or RNA helicase